MALSLIVGIAGGFYYGNKTDGQQAIEVTSSNKDETAPTSDVKPDASKKALALQKLDLLKRYTDFVKLPQNQVADPTKYANDMGEIVKAINDNKITAKFYATGETDNKEQKIVDFLDYLNESIKSDLN